MRFAKMGRGEDGMLGNGWNVAGCFVTVGS